MNPTPDQQRRRRLRQRIEQRSPLLIPGTGDALGARLIERAGFEAVYVSGYSIEGTHAYPDVGLLGMSEVARRAAEVVSATNLPVLCDADTGYGGIVQVVRTVREFERAGVAAIQLEDQALPKQCGSMAGKQLVALPEMVAKIRAAVDARVDPDFLIIGRTDSIATEGIAAAMARLDAYAEAGADLLMALGPYAVDDVRRLAGAARRPLVYLNSESFTMPMLPPAELHDAGIDIVVFPLSLLLSATHAMQRTLAQIRRFGTTRPVCADTMVSWAEFNEIAGLPEIRELEGRYTDTRVR